MTKLSTLSLISFVLALGTAGSALAQGSLAGSWKLSMGNSVPCALSMTDDGAVTPAPDCTYGASLARWTATPSAVLLKTSNGEVYAILKAKGDAYAGITAADSRGLVLSH